jgi:hypothetical protein
LPGDVKATVTLPLPGVAVPIAGAPGTVAGVTVLDEAEGVLVPTALVAVTVQDTGVPLASPVTVIGEAGPLALCPPQVAVNPVIADPPSEPAVKPTVTLVLPAAAVPMVGALGTVAGVMLPDGAEAGPVPMALVAVTVHVTGVPLARPVTVMGDVGPLALCAPQVAV